VWARSAALVLLLTISACSAKQPESVGGAGLADCPASPNCVSSRAAAGSAAYVEPLVIAGGVDEAWRTAVDEISSWRRVEIVALNETALHAVAVSALFRFQDDVELRLEPLAGRIDVRSASRLGHSDLGVNRRRVERLRAALIERGVVREAAPNDPALAPQAGPSTPAAPPPQVVEPEAP